MGAFMEGAMDTNPITFSEEDGMDFAATTVQLPDGEYVPFLFTCKQLLANGDGSEFKPGFTWGGEFNVPSYRTGGFLDPKGRGMYLGYDQAVALPASQADGRGGQDSKNDLAEGHLLWKDRVMSARAVKHAV